jgi:hypothetical protein
MEGDGSPGIEKRKPLPYPAYGKYSPPYTCKKVTFRVCKILFALDRLDKKVNENL